MTRSTLVILCFVLLVALAACSRSGQGPTGETANNPAASPEAQRITSESLVRAEANPVEISAGGSGQAIVRVTVQPGYHINANPPSYPYLKATEVEVADLEDMSVDYVYYPNPLVKKFEFAEGPLKVYEGETPVTIAFKVAKSAKKGERSISGTLRIQACDDRVCYPPGSIGVKIPFTVK
ncbi:MAG: protein-disulfide reductase DsbD domain-containing protein [Pyrinomonadaceae bacterium]